MSMIHLLNFEFIKSRLQFSLLYRFNSAYITVLHISELSLSVVFYKSSDLRMKQPVERREMLEDDNSLAGSLQGSPAPSTVEGDSGRESGIDNEGFTSDSEEASSTTNDVIECPKKVCS